ncbi:hypothetical protein [Vibrio taketomensis]|nr:hypothetical protein [Vibrio taketomensis]
MAAYLKNGFSIDNAKKATDIAVDNEVDSFVDEQFKNKDAAGITTRIAEFGKKDD